MRDQSNGEGWLIFAGIVLMTAGVMRFFDAIWAWTYNGPLPDNLQQTLLGRSLTTYGWVWLFVAIILFGSGAAVIVRSQFARWIGIAAAAIGAITANLVDLLLPGLVVRLHPDSHVGHLQPGGPRPARGRSVSLPLKQRRGPDRYYRSKTVSV